MYDVITMGAATRRRLTWCSSIRHFARTICLKCFPRWFRAWLQAPWSTSKRRGRPRFRRRGWCGAAAARAR